MLLSFKNILSWGKGARFAFEMLSLQYASFPLNPSIRSLMYMRFVFFPCMLLLSLLSFPKMSVKHARRHIICWSHRIYIYHIEYIFNIHGKRQQLVSQFEKPLQHVASVKLYVFIFRAHVGAQCCKQTRTEDVA